MVFPNTKGISGGMANPTSNATHQFAVWYDLSDEVHIGRIQRGAQRWGIDHDEYLVAGAARTALALPVANDEHNYPSIAVDGNGHLHVWCNMHNNPLRYIKTTAAHTTDGWLATAGWTDASGDMPGIQDRCTYPTPVPFPDGSLGFYIRSGGDGVSGMLDSLWTIRTPTGTTWATMSMLFQGLSVPNGRGPGVPGGDGLTGTEDATNWSVYPTNFHVESPRDPYPGRLHIGFAWRSGGVDGQSQVLPGYMYSDDKGVTWKTIDGVALTVPITPLNSIAARIGIGSGFYSGINRTSNVVTATHDTPDHGYIVGDPITCYNNGSFAGTFTVTAVGTPGANDIQWAQTGSNETGTSGATTMTGTTCKYRWFNWGSLAIDAHGLPHMVVSTAPARYIRRNATNTAWDISQVAQPLGGASGEIHAVTFGGLFFMRGHLWGLVRTWETIDASWTFRVRLLRISGTGTMPRVKLSGSVPDAFDPSYDFEAYRLFGSIETLVPDGNDVHVYRFGGFQRRFVAA